MPAPIAARRLLDMDFHTRRVLLCMRYGIGDVVMELPVVEALRRALPHARLTVLAAPPATELLEGHPAVDAVCSLAEWSIRHRWDRGPPGAGRAIAAWLDRHDFDLFLDIHHAPPVIGETVWSRAVRSLEADERAERAVVRRGGSGVEAIQEAVRAGWGLPIPRGRLPRLTVPGEEREAAADFLRRHGIHGSEPCAVSPVASLGLKQWPPERLARLADRVIEQRDEPIVAFCGPQDSAGALLQRHMRHARRVVRVGPHHLLRVAAILERCGAFICNDTGLMHMAGALGVPTVAVFGPTAPSIYRPPQSWVVSVGGEWVECPHRNLSSLHPPACFSEGRCLVADRGCIHGAAEEEVWRALQKALQRAERTVDVDAPSVA